MTRKYDIRWTAIVALVAAAACGDQTAPDTQPRPVHSLEAVSPQPDTAAAGASRVLEVRARDAQGFGVAGVEITWHATQSGDVIQPAVDTTDAAGLSTVMLRVGQVAGAHGVVATTRNLISRSFFVHVLPAPIASLEVLPGNLSLISRQTARLVAQTADSAGNATPVPVRFGSTDDRVATVDSVGVVRARRAGRATIYANATVPPFLIDSAIVVVREATPMELQIRSDANTLAVGATMRMTAMALDSLGRPIDAELITWTIDRQHVRSWFSEVFADSSVIYLGGELAGSTAVTAAIGSMSEETLIEVVIDKLVQKYEAGISWCSGGITFGPSGQWYYIQTVGGAPPSDTLALVRTGKRGVSTWDRSAQFGECKRGFGRLPRPTISIDANEYLYVPTRGGVLSIAGSSGEQRWFAPIGPVEGNIAISAAGTLIVGTDSAVVALDSRGGEVVWRRPQPLLDRTASAVIDESRGVAYVTGRFVLSAVNLGTGQQLWELPSSDSIAGAAIARDGTLYVGAVGKLFAVSPAGQVIAQQRFDGGASGSPAIGADGRVYIATYPFTLRAFTADLTPLWSYNHGQGAFAGMDSPAVDREGIVYAGTGGGAIAVKDGRLLWQFGDAQTGGSAQYWTLGPDGDLYASTWQGVFRLRANGADPQAPWPMTHRSAARSAAR